MQAVASFERRCQLPHLKLADESIYQARSSSDSNLNQEAILQSALQTECQAIHPGFGFLSENARFTQRCKQQGLTFIGPEASHISLMGDKARARETMKEHGVPVLPGSEGLIGSVEDAQTFNEMGYPILLKATAGGGGKGMRIVALLMNCLHCIKMPLAKQKKPSVTPICMNTSRRTSHRISDFGRSLRPSHSPGRTRVFYSAQPPKTLGRSPVDNLSPQQRNELGETIVMPCEIGYINAGTMGFLMDGDGKLYFMEMNTRIQVEHPVTEMVTGVDLVAWQLRIAAGQFR